jgi:hypothetical protein
MMVRLICVLGYTIELLDSDVLGAKERVDLSLYFLVQATASSYDAHTTRSNPLSNPWNYIAIVTHELTHVRTDRQPRGSDVYDCCLWIRWLYNDVQKACLEYTIAS